MGLGRGTEEGRKVEGYNNIADVPIITQGSIYPHGSRGALPHTYIMPLLWRVLRRESYLELHR